jgi:hypothetical protein
LSDFQNPEIAATIARLLQRIASAFAGVPRPKITRHVAMAIDDDWVVPPERAWELAALDTEQDWTEVTDGAIEQCHTYFAFSDAEGWRFYLPAYISYYLRHFPNPNFDVAYWACTNPNPQFDLLTPDQLACVHEFVALVHAQVQPDHWRDA